MNFYYDWIETPLGAMLALARDGALMELKFVESDRAADEMARLFKLGARKHDEGLRKVRSQLQEYFAGERGRFDLALGAEGSEYAQRVWIALCDIPYGETRSYGELARALSSSPRAIGRANATNPVAIVVPCHRVIGNDGSLTGYAGGITRKSALLALERGERAWMGERMELELIA